VEPQLEVGRPGDLLVAVVATLLPFLIVGAGAYLFISFLDGTMKSSGGYQQALAMARADPVAIQALGTPIKDGWFPTGHVESGGSGGSSDLAIPVSGPNGGGTLYMRATSDMGDWHITRLVLKVKSTGEEIDLLQTVP
jgi:hypothetical protein